MGQGGQYDAGGDPDKQLQVQTQFLNAPYPMANKAKEYPLKPADIAAQQPSTTLRLSKNIAPGQYQYAFGQDVSLLTKADRVIAKTTEIGFGDLGDDSGISQRYRGLHTGTTISKKKDGGLLRDQLRRVRS